MHVRRCCSSDEGTLLCGAGATDADPVGFLRLTASCALILRCLALGGADALRGVRAERARRGVPSDGLLCAAFVGLGSKICGDFLTRPGMKRERYGTVRYAARRG